MKDLGLNPGLDTEASDGCRWEGLEDWLGQDLSMWGSRGLFKEKVSVI